MQLMKTDHPNQSAAVFLQTVSVALAQLKQRLQQDYEQVYPDLHLVIRIVLDMEEARARELTSFPHLLFPDMVEAHLASLNMRPVGTRHHAREQHEVQTYESAFAVCG
jgi:hypothetical protein